MRAYQKSLDVSMLQPRHIARGYAVRIIAAALLAIGAAACEGAVVEDQFDEFNNRETVFGEGGLAGNVGGLLGGQEDGAGGSGIPVNAFLWRAALDTIAFMPLSSADPFGGTIITDWYADAGDGAERFKMNVIILSRELVADGVSARVFRQVRDPQGPGWVDAGVDTGTPARIENAILQRARELRIAAAAQ